MCLFLVNNTLLCIKKFFFYPRITLYPSSILLLPHPVHTLPHPDARVTLTPNTGRGSGCAKGSIGFARGRTLPVSGVKGKGTPTCPSPIDWADGWGERDRAVWVWVTL